jgi:peptidoglycan/LPS O-acetylase OafA/YrhL
LITAPATARQFRSDIQGMRALAVGVVILAHSGFRTFSGGFVGVDVFFVISGFLITSLLMREADRAGRISLVGFYARRARRILPAAVVVAVATVVASILFLPLVRAVEIIKDSLWSAAFAANFRFAAVGTDYFAKGEPSSPLQHYWSLSVEEQYYLVWPLLLIGWLWVARRRGSGPRRRWLLVVLGLASLASLLWSIHATHAAPTSAYFSSLTRAWELGLGSATAILLSRGHLRAPRWLREALAVAGLAAIAFATFAFDANTPFPGILAAVPVLGTVLLLATGAAPQEQATLVGRLLSLRPARVLGDWSYSLYLWHWPVIRIAEDHLQQRRLSLVALAFALVAIVALSAATYRWVETPFRRGVVWSRPRYGVALYPLSLLVVLVAAVGGRTWVDLELGAYGDRPAISTADFADENLSEDPVVALVEASVLAAREGRAVPSDLEPPVLGLRKQTATLGDCDYRTGTQRLCPMGDSGSERKIAVVGDSHARAWTPAIDRVGELAGYATYNFVYSGCSATTNIQVDIDTQRPFQACEDFKAWTQQALRKLQPDLIIVATSALSPVLDSGGSFVNIGTDPAGFKEAAREGFASHLRLMKALAPRVAVLGGTPKLPREPGVCLSSGSVDLGDCLFRRGPIRHAIQREFSHAAEDLGAQFVDASKWFCFQRDCPAVVGRVITMRDSEHVTPTYARMLGEPLAFRLGLLRS